MAPNMKTRRLIAKDTIDRSPAIVSEHKAQGASVDSTFIQKQLPALDQTSCPNHISAEVDIINTDSFAAARTILASDTAGKVAVLNLASDILPAGPWLQVMTTTQEEALCYSSTLYITLKAEYYPWPNAGAGCVKGIYSPGVVVFRDDLDHDCVELPHDVRRIVSVITVAAPAWPDLKNDPNGEGKVFAQPERLTELREKIRLVYRMAAHNGQEYLILGAMGCGAYACPPKVVATEMRDILLEQEFRGWFKKVVFAIYSRPGNGLANFDIFKTAFERVKV